MPKKISDAELDDIVATVARMPTGGSIDEIGAMPNNVLPRRTLQRRLARLVKQKRLLRQGRGPATRYRLPAAGDRVLKGQPPTAENDIPISAEAEPIRQAVRQPIHNRRPVGYDRRFLDAYRPNETYYLPSEPRARLMDMGKPAENGLPAGTHVRQIYNRLLIDLSWNSSRLEGNTYSLLETERLLQLGEAAAGKDAREAQMILNHKSAIELLLECSDEVGFNRYTILNFHALLADNLLADASACGRLRTISVGIDGTVFHPLDVSQLIDECFQQILDTADAILDPFEQSLFNHGPYSVFTALRRCKQACFPSCRQSAVCTTKLKPPVLC